MGLFKTWLGKGDDKPKKEEKTLPWIPLTSLEQLDDIEKRSTARTQIIFKHSTTCGISSMVIKMFSNLYPFSEEEADLYYLDLHAYREVSNETAYKFQVMHQSPQLLVVRNGNTVAHESHGAITEIDLEKYI